jgi:diguanylate cyclase (GGDEF)-like protein
MTQESDIFGREISTDSTSDTKPAEYRDQVRNPCLLFLAGIDSGRLIKLDLSKGPLSIGRGDPTGISLDSPEVSRKHAELLLNKDNLLEIHDNESLNGTFVNGTRVEMSSVNSADRIRLGPHTEMKLVYYDEDEVDVFQQLFGHANSDYLTGAANRRHFMQSLTREWSYAVRHKKNLSLALVDIDHFKQINDTYGHPVGDQVLIELVARLKKAVRVEDLTVRYGGEEFAVLLRDTNAKGAEKQAERILKGVSEAPFGTGDQLIEVSVSIGVVSVKDSDFKRLSREDFIRIADERLFMAKQSGRGRYVNQPSLDFQRSPTQVSAKVIFDDTQGPIENPED